MNKNGTPQNLKPQVAKWNSPTVAIRVPEQYRDLILAYARALDSGDLVEQSTARKVSDFTVNSLKKEPVIKVKYLIEAGILKDE